MTAEETAAVVELVEEALRMEVGIGLIPDGDGFEVIHIDVDNWPGIQDYEVGVRRLATAYDVGTAAKAALKPLRDVEPQLVRRRGRG